MKILVTGFDPFNGDTTNPSWEAVSLLPDAIGGTDVVRIQVPTKFRESIIHVAQAIEMHRPDAVLMVGQAGGRRGLTVERVAINVEDATIADNAGVSPTDRPVTTEGPVAYWSTLPIKDIVAGIRAENIDASISNSAGTFVCNHLMYGVLHYLASTGAAWDGESGIRAGFIHVPFTPEQARIAGETIEAPAMETGEVARGLEAAIRAT